MRRAALLVVLTVGLLAALAAPAAAQTGAQPLFESLYQDVKTWVDNTGAPAAMLTLGERLLVVLVILQFYRGWVGQSAQAMAGALVRLGMGAFLLHLVAIGTIDGLLGSAYTAFGNVGFSVLRSSGGQVTQTLTELLGRIHDSVGALLGGAVGIFLPLLAGATILGVLVVWLLLLGAFVALYVMIQVFALLILGLAALLAPVSFAALGFEGTARWAWRWVSGILNALVMVLMANLAAGAAMALVSKVPATFLEGLTGGVAGGEVGKALVGLITPMLIFFLVPLFGILALVKVETVVAHFTDAFGDMTATMVDLATGALLWRGYRAAFAGTGGGGGGGGGGAPSPTGGGGVAPSPAPTTALAPWRGGPPAQVTTAGPPGGGTYAPGGGAASWTRRPATSGAGGAAGAPFGGGAAGATTTTVGGEPTWAGSIPFDPAPWRASGGSILGPSLGPSADAIATHFERQGWVRESATDISVTLRGAGAMEDRTVTVNQSTDAAKMRWTDNTGSVHVVHYRADGDVGWHGPRGEAKVIGRWRQST